VPAALFFFSSNRLPKPLPSFVFPSRPRALSHTHTRALSLTHTRTHPGARHGTPSTSRPPTRTMPVPKTVGDLEDAARRVVDKVVEYGKVCV
jgi:hypothetical protein